MYSKQLIGIAAAIVSLALLAGCGSSKTLQEPILEEEVVVVEETNNSFSISKDQCIEVMAYALKVVELQVKGDMQSAMQWAEKTSDLQDKHLSDNPNYEEACGAYALEDPGMMTKAQEQSKKLK